MVDAVKQMISASFLKLSKRAESVDRATLAKTFVDIGPLVNVISSNDHQIIFGRRGTGKTHALMYLAEISEKNGNFPVYIDMRTIGLTGGIYSDANVPLAERATRLLVDTLIAIHDGLLVIAISDAKINLATFAPVLDEFAEAAAHVNIVGPTSEETTVGKTHKEADDSELKFELSATPALNIESSGNSSDESQELHKVARSGNRVHNVRFGSLGRAAEKIVSELAGRHLLIILDEWSTIPLDLQPYLADLIRRALLPHRGLIVKIGAIEQRSNFILAGQRGDYIGIEVGADVTADLNLDDFMVFNNDAKRATDFFKSPIFRHFQSVISGEDETVAPKDASDLIRNAFSQVTSFEELVRAAEGVPRDAINILGLAAQKAWGESCTIAHIRAASKAWYLRDKEAAVGANPQARALLHWIIDEVIAHRQSKAFLLRNDTNDDLIEALFDARVLHVLKRNIAAHDQPGIRYHVFGIDFGCYVDLLQTKKAPQGLFKTDDDGDATFFDVPPDDYRAIRRAVLNLDAFYIKNPVGA